MRRGTQRGAKGIVIYGPGKVGKTELAANIKGIGLKPLFIDIGDGTNHLDVDRVLDGAATWDDLRAVLHNETLCKDYNVIVVDDLTKADELSTKWVIENVRHEKGHPVTSIEGYGFGKGTTHNYENFLKLIGDFDAQKRRGRHVIAICHECINEPENPDGQNFAQYQPRLQTTKKGGNSIRHRVKEWADYLLFLNFDVFVDGDGKAKGSGTRTIYPSALPGFWAGARTAEDQTLNDPIVYERGSCDLWRKLLTPEGK